MDKPMNHRNSGYPPEQCYPKEQRDAVYRVIAERRDVRRGTLMLVAAAEFLGNVLILSWPAG